jgi:hypothetical protein
VEELRKVREYRRLRHPTGEVPQHIADGDACAAYTGLAEADGRVNGDAAQEVHIPTLGERPSAVKPREHGWEALDALA